MTETSPLPIVVPERRHPKLAFPLVFVGLLILLVITAFVSLGLGVVPVGDVFDAVWRPTNDPIRTIVYEVRLPRILLAMLIGVALGTSGAAYQALFRNPLADPFIVGASSGAATGATLVIVMGWTGSVAGIGATSIGAFAGTLLAVWLVYAVASVGRMPSVTMLLAGAAISTMLSGLVWLMMALANEQFQKIIYWLMGGLNGKGMPEVARTWPLLLGGAGVLCLLGRPLDAVCCGEDVARSLGLRVGAIFALVLAAASLVVATSVAVGGIVGFIGLAAPHLTRPLVGAAHVRLIPASGLVGAILLLIADGIARSIVPPLELPLSAITALIGGPIFLIVLRRTASHATGGT